MYRIAYDVTAYQLNPLSGVAQVVINTVKAANAQPKIQPSYYSYKNRTSISNDMNQIKSVYTGRFSFSTYDISHSLNHRLLPLKARKKIYTVHDVWSLEKNRYQEPSFQKKMSKRMRADIRSADVIVSISQATQQRLLEFGLVSPEKCHVVPVGWELPFSDNSNFSIEHSEMLKKQYVLSIGTLEVRKNLEHVLDAVRPLSDVHLVLVGAPGFGYDQIQDRLAAFPSERLFYLPAVQREDIKILYEKALALLLPSWEEGAGLPILEGMGTGCPVITSNCSANAEYGAEGAILINPCNPEESTEALNHLGNNSEYRKEVILKGKKRAEIYSWNNYFNTLFQIYQKLLDS